MPMDCMWSRFGEWSQCSASCGGGTQRRSRRVLLDATGGGRRCSGKSEETKSCNLNSCNIGKGKKSLVLRAQSRVFVIKADCKWL